MPRTFSLSRLLLFITLLCLLCGLAVNFPLQTLAFVFIAGAFVPTAIVCLTLVSFSRRRMTVLIISMLGAGICVLLGPAQIHMGPPPRTVWESVQPLYAGMSFPALGALLLGATALAADAFLQPRREN
jgi:hypothetical protein